MCETFTRPGYGEPALIVVPKAESAWVRTIASGSAIVAFRNDADHLVVYYEGNLYGASNLRRFDDRASMAYGRLTQRAPTVAMAMVSASEFVIVGRMTPGQLTISEPGLLDQWLQGAAVQQPSARRS